MASERDTGFLVSACITTVRLLPRLSGRLAAPLCTCAYMEVHGPQGWLVQIPTGRSWSCLTTIFCSILCGEDDQGWDMWIYPSGVQSTPDLAWDGMFLIQRHIYRIPIVHAEICEQSKLGANTTPPRHACIGRQTADLSVVGCLPFGC
jgi:hypothetical protein